ncbi:MAG TPA: DNA-processing protein DprA [Alphaproteobacteria bacterium]|nr:DNA-processing protein DprA [Alphaproteobacteria bacterium]
MGRGKSFSAGERLDWLRLIRSENVGPITFYQLLERYGNAAAALEALPQLARRGGRERPIKIPTRAAVEAEVKEAASFGATLLCRDESAYPATLRAIEDAPPVLFLRGHVHLLEKRMIAIVGARNASVNGRRFAKALAAELGQAGLVVVSGLARGVDASAHEGALATGTVAVMAGGVDVVYPEENRKLYDAVVGQGLALSEMPPGTVPQGRHFPRRNRIVSGLALGVVVVEAAERSGSLITARLAADQGREVFAVPGSPLDPRSKGANGLLREGAHLVETAADVLAGIEGLTPKPLAEPPPEPPAGPPKPPPDSELQRARRLVLEALGPQPVPVDELLRHTHLSPAVMSLVLLELELAGRLERQPGNRVSLLF